MATLPHLSLRSPGADRFISSPQSLAAATPATEEAEEVRGGNRAALGSPLVFSPPSLLRSPFRSPPLPFPCLPFRPRPSLSCLFICFSFARSSPLPPSKNRWPPVAQQLPMRACNMELGKRRKGSQARREVRSMRLMKPASSSETSGRAAKSKVKVRQGSALLPPVKRCVWVGGCLR